MPSVPDRLEIDFLILARRAEVINGQLYMMGGGWDQLGIADFNQPAPLSLAVGVLVPWTEANEEHALTIAVESEDRKKVAPDLYVKLNVGRPPGSVRGQSFRVMIAVNSALRLPGPGSYSVVAKLADAEKRVVFHVAPVQPPSRSHIG